MNTETKPKKESKLDIDSNYDLRLVSTLSPALRWVLTLPIAFIAMFAVQVGFGTLVKLINSNLPMGEIVNTIMLSTVMLAKYAIFVIAATSTAPVARNKKFIVSLQQHLLEHYYVLAVQQSAFHFLLQLIRQC